MSAPRPATLALGLGAAVAAISSAATLILVAQPLPAAVIAAGRVLVTGVALVLLGCRALGSLRAPLRDPAVVGRMVAASLLLALHFGAWVASLTMTSVARSVALVATQPLFAGLLGRWVGDRAPWSLWAGSVLALLGTAIMVGEGGSLGSDFGLGDGLALVAAAAATGYLVIGRSVRDRVPLRPYLGVVHLGAALVLGAWLLVGGRDPWPDGVDALDPWVVVALGLLPGVVGHGLLNWAVRHVPVYVVSLAVLLEPVGATLLAMAVMGSLVTPAEAIGAGVLLVGVALGVPRRSPRT